MNQQASAVAAVNPRDIAFVIDLSGSMNDDTSPGSSTSSPSLMQTVYNEFGFGTYPGSTQTLKSGKSNTSTMTNQMPSVMPNAIPVPNTSSSSSVSYWGNYFSYAETQWSAIGLPIVSGLHDVLRSGREARRHELHSVVA